MLFLIRVFGSKGGFRGSIDAAYYVPVAKQFALFKQIMPNMKSVLLLHQDRHPSTEIDSVLTAKVCAQMGIKLYEADSITSDDLVASNLVKNHSL
ncbi:MAG: hypothetical protein KAS93_00395 [Gammaproteobacteria bacterium]|nr:hypothetical protein [Gammaproteobacteria bacterium]